MPNLLPRILDFLLMAGAAALYGGCLTALLTTGTLGWALPVAPYVYGTRDFYLDAVVAGLAGLALLVLVERIGAVRGSAVLRALAFFAATLVALCLAPPSPQVFGNTWAAGEAFSELFLAQWRLVLPIALAALVLRTLLRRTRH